MKTTVILRDDARNRWLRFESPVRTVCAGRPGEVLHALRTVETAVNRDGLHAAGFISYEAGPAMDAALRVRNTGAFPLVWFGLFKPPTVLDRLPDMPATGAIPRRWTSSVDRAAYRRAVQRIQEYIHAGDTYQVNYSYRLRQPLRMTPWELFRRMLNRHPPPHAAFIETQDWAICSASPELFFSLDGMRIASRPMKGTAPRGKLLADDIEHAEELRASAKNRAENVMIVDMVRNDLGRIALPGTVRVESLFDIEKYPTVWQMTSTVAARTRASFVAILRALFPAASITGAPKARTMEIIRELETTPRRIYCGCIGYLAPKRKARFNVAIRTVLVNKRDCRAEYGVGGAIIWDSAAAAEFEECRTKSLVLFNHDPDFSLLETMLWTPQDGFLLLDLHLARMASSARYFDIPWRVSSVSRKLNAAAKEFAAQPQRIRLLLNQAGACMLETHPLVIPSRPKPLRICLARKAVASDSIFLYHKTTHRALYETARAQAPGFDEVLLWNKRHEVTEFTTGNVAARIGGELVTPPVKCGLLGGVYRQYLLDRKLLREAVISIADLGSCSALFHINSLRGMRRANFKQTPE